MPKGVEHLERFLKKVAFYGCVESLMPKGVEHTFLVFLLNLLLRVESLMPKGVEHFPKLKGHFYQKNVSNL